MMMMTSRLRPRRFFQLLLFLLLPAPLSSAANNNNNNNRNDKAAADIVAIVPDRNSVFRNEFHNALRTGAFQHNASLEIRDTGNYDLELYDAFLAQAGLPQTPQPQVYLYWPPEQTNRTARRLRAIREQHPDVVLLQIFTYPQDDEAWEFVTAFYGNDALYEGRLCADMSLQALREQLPQGQPRGVVQRQVAVMGFREGYDKGDLILQGFRQRLQQQRDAVLQEHQMAVDLVQTKFPSAFGEQAAYYALLDMVHQFRQANANNMNNNHFVHVLFCMDDAILTGAYQALKDLRLDNQVTLVGTACNGARDLISTGAQWGTTLVSPMLVGQGAVAFAAELMNHHTHLNNSNDRSRYQEEIPIYHGNAWQEQLVQVSYGHDEVQYTIDQLCPWKLTYTRVAGLQNVEDVPGFPQETDLLCDLVSCKFIPTALYMVGYSLAGIIYGIVVLSAVLLYAYRDQKILQMAQPFFLSLLLLGTVVDTTSIVFMSRDHRSYRLAQLNASCVAWPWLLCIGHMMTTATLVAKIARVKQVCIPAGGGSGFKKVTVRWKQAVVLILALVAVDVVLLGIWYGLDPLQWQISAYSYESAGYISEVYGQCDFAHTTNVSWLFPSLLLVWHSAVLLYAHWLVYETRHFHRLSDSRHVVIALFNSLQLLIVTVSLMFGGKSDEASYMIRVLFVFLNNFWVLVLVITLKLWACLRGRGNELPDFHEMRVRDSRRRSQHPRQSTSAAGAPGSGSGGGMPDMSSVFDIRSVRQSMVDATGSSDGKNPPETVAVLSSVFPDGSDVFARTPSLMEDSRDGADSSGDPIHPEKIAQLPFE